MTLEQGVNPLNPQPTPFDLRWRLFGIHFRVHPGFWLFSAFWGWGMCQNQKGEIVWPSLAAWIICTFISVLIHELGHVTMGRLCGQKGNIVLHSFGGVAVGQYQLTRRWQQMAIALAGPFAGLLLFATVWILVMPPIRFERFGLVDFQAPQLIKKLDPVGNLGWLTRGANFLLFMTFMWNVMNLIPVLPMDGGQVVRSGLGGDTSPTGLRIALTISFVTAAGIAWYAWMATKDDAMWFFNIPSWVTLTFPTQRLMPLMILIFFGIMAAINLWTLVNVRRPGPVEDHEDHERYERDQRDERHVEDDYRHRP